MTQLLTETKHSTARCHVMSPPLVQFACLGGGQCDAILRAVNSDAAQLMADSDPATAARLRAELDACNAHLRSLKLNGQSAQPAARLG